MFGGRSIFVPKFCQKVEIFNFSTDRSKAKVEIHIFILWRKSWHFCMFFRQRRERIWNLHVLHYGMNILLIWKIMEKLLLSKQRSTHSLITLKICYTWVIGCCIKERVASENVKFLALKFWQKCWNVPFFYWAVRRKSWNYEF